jgi:2-hydroxychromene-2-carboxylate isomerase
MTRRPARRPRLYFSFRSPYSWMAVHRLRQALPDAFQRIELMPYWDPDEQTTRALLERDAELPYQQMSRAKHRYVLIDTKRLATRAGLAMAWPVDVDPWWELPHLGWLAAHRAGYGEQCYDALVAARWQQGLDICTPEVFTKAVAGAGLDSDALLAAAHRPDVRAAGVDCLVSAYHDDVFGVPFLLSGRQRYWGFDRVDMFLADLRAGRPDVDVRVPATVPSSGYDTDTAGGCG